MSPPLCEAPSRYQYTAGCRCAGCTEANRAYIAAWRDRRREAHTHRLIHGRWVRQNSERETA